MTKGTIFNIQKFSIHDGPGIRTTIFLKGCPLQCKWCSNPESQSNQIQILHDASKCIHCLLCIQACPQHAISHLDHKIMIDHQKCIGCLSCCNVCKQEALKNEGEQKEIAEIVKTCLQDKDFYEESGGGVTISGGEGMCQPTFLIELVTALKKHHIHLAIETTGYIPEKTFQELAVMFDLLLFDVKHYDEKRHILGTGVSNSLILKNLAWAIQQGLEVLPRIPVIPDFNDSLKDTSSFVNVLKQVGATRVQLLPFHQFGEKKYELLNKEYQLKNKKALCKEDLKEYQQVFLSKGIDCFF